MRTDGQSVAAVCARAEVSRSSQSIFSNNLMSNFTFLKSQWPAVQEANKGFDVMGQTTERVPVPKEEISSRASWIAR